ncbi:hypothetical protein EIP91_005323 [Steccherinum ochraceum]|uniref:Uncharacterized protein n=1 Tax=Steccherinum ochraceum TaxID=92696 RepID=A0A4R0R7M3_9APHY|nr:hypothetical protein EIP91_005323 [Steccherinum ochraceum]
MGYNSEGANQRDDLTTHLESTYQEVEDAMTPSVLGSSSLLSPDAPFLHSFKFDAGDTQAVWRKLALAGAVCGAGILGINRFIRMPVKRMYGRIGVGAAFVASAYRDIDLASTNNLYRIQRQDPHLRVIWNSYKVFSGTVTSVDRSFADVYEEYGYDEEERRLRESEGMNGLWIHRYFRALATHSLRGHFEAYNLSLEDAHRLTVIVCGSLQHVRSDAASWKVRQYGCVAAALGFLSPWSLLVAPMFLASVGSLCIWMLLDPIRYKYLVHCGASLDDVPRIAEMLKHLVDPQRPNYPDEKLSRMLMARIEEQKEEQKKMEQRAQQAELDAEKKSSGPK